MRQSITADPFYAIDALMYLIKQSGNNELVFTEEQHNSIPDDARLHTSADVDEITGEFTSIYFTLEETPNA